MGSCHRRKVGQAFARMQARRIAKPRCGPAILMMMLLLALTAPAQNIINTVAGGGPTTSAPLKADIPQPMSVAKDAQGNIYIASPWEETVLKLSSGVLTVLAGKGYAGYSGDGGLAKAATLDFPAAVALDSLGNVYIADEFNERIRKVNVSTGVITTIAGNGKTCSPATASCGDGGLATAAQLGYPTGLAVDGSGDVYIADSRIHRIRRVAASSGLISTIAGNGNICPDPTTACGDGGPAAMALLDYPQGVAVDSAGNVVIADSNDNRVRRVSGGITSTIAGTGNFCSTSGCGDGGPAINATMGSPTDVSFDSSGNLFVADQDDSVIRRLDASTGLISTVAGNYFVGFSGNGGAATSAELGYPQAVFAEGSGALLIADTYNSQIRYVDSTQNIQALAGGFGAGDGGSATSATLAYPAAVAVDSSGNILVVDTMHNRIRRKSASSSTITNFIGSGSAFDQSVTNWPPTSVPLGDPQALAFDPSGNLFIVSGNMIDEFDASINEVSTYAGTGVCATPTDPCGDGEPAMNAGFLAIFGLAVDAHGNVYVADTGANRVRKIEAGGQLITTVAGTGVAGFSGDGGPATSAELSAPYGVAVDQAGNVYIADGNNNRVRRVNTTGIITTYAYNGKATFSGDGVLATLASRAIPAQLAVDGKGNLFVGGGADSLVQRIDAATHTIAVVAGNPSQPTAAGFKGDGGLARKATLGNWGLTVKGTELYIADESNNRIRTVHLTPTLTMSATSIAFGTVGSISTKKVGVKNTGGDDLVITGVSSNNTAFVPTNHCGNPVAPMTSCSISVAFTPKITGLITGTLSITSNSGTRTVSLSGSGQ